MKDPGLYHIMGGDFLIDQNLKIWVIEVNSGPGMKIPNDNIRQMKGSMLKDSFDILFHMIEKRTKKIINFLNKNVKKYKKNTEILEGVFDAIDLNQLREDFKKLNHNEIDKDFEKKNAKSLVKIVDLSNPENPFYYGMDKECINV